MQQRFSSAGASPGCIWEITARQCLSRGPRRRWLVVVAQSGQPSRDVILEDPAPRENYAGHDAFLLSPEATNHPRTVNDNDRQLRVQVYCESLGSQLGVQNTTGLLKIYVCETVHDANEAVHDADNCSIHSLLWELLEHDAYTQSYRNRFEVRITRIFTSVGSTALPVGLRYPERPVRALLVVSRSWQLAPANAGTRYADIPPRLVHHTLCQLTSFLAKEGRSHRFKIHVVRPGGMNELKRHLECARHSNVFVDSSHPPPAARQAKLIYQPLNSTNRKPELLFALPYGGKRFDLSSKDGRLDFSSSAFEFVEAEPLAELLQQHGITVVALNACQSAYMQEGQISNLCHTLLKHRVNAVTAMAFSGRGATASLYYQGFYSSLIIANESYSSASASGRAYLRKNDDGPLGEEELEPSTLLVTIRRKSTDNDELEHGNSPVLRKRDTLHTIAYFILFLFFIWALILHMKADVTVEGLLAFVVGPLAVVCLFIHKIEPEINLPDLSQSKDKFLKLLHLQTAEKFLKLFHLQSADRFLELLHLRAAAKFLKLLHLQSADRFLKYLHSQSADKFLKLLRSQSADSSGLGIGMMVLEDILATEDYIFIQLESSPMSERQLSDLQYVVETWKTTEFIHDVSFVESERLFTFGWYYKDYLERKLSNLFSHRPWATSNSGLARSPEHSSESRGQHSRSSILIFTDFDCIFDEERTPEERNMALACVSRLVGRLSRTQFLHLIFIGNADVPWEKGDINPRTHVWVQGPKLLARGDLGMV
ncbi:uncharacterized protein FTOL_00010 [Fusarium torulosum]|uniref:CHAT domain-containing protein n=1 Tax=Fusarium torulosum TaxID=33205 RepID=A0AAE8LXC8_9HYPO|nr:uncharacterized protein FTOL_00010 [Fusarium torulosum]